MPYETTCPKGHRLQVSDAHLGQRIQCPACNESFVAEGSRLPSPPPPNLGGWKAPPETASELPRLARWTGRPLVAVGLILVLLSKGCDTINFHSANRAAAIAQAAVDQFDEDLQAHKLALQNEIKSIGHENGKADESKSEEKKRLDELHKQLLDLDTQAAKDRSGKEAGEWRELKSAARKAKQAVAINGYWHVLFFIFSAVVLSIGLLIVSWGAEGAERWVSLVMLAIITYSLFVSSLAWNPVN